MDKVAPKCIQAAVIFLLAISCQSVSAVHFESKVNTKSRPIDYQIKSTFVLDEIGVYASNEFDGARLNGFKMQNDSTALVIIKPENQPINNSPYYAFDIWSDHNRPFYLTFDYPKGYKHRYIPKIRKSGIWSILDSTRMFKKDSIVTIKINLSPDPLTVAAQEIQSSKDVSDWYTPIVNKNPYVTKKVVGQTTLGRDLVALDIQKPSNTEKKLVVLLTRQHPPEVTGYYAFQSFLQTILDNSVLTNDFLDQYRVLAFPLMNPDGVDLGHWRHNAGGVDTNRDWSKYRQPEVRNTVRYIENVIKEEKMELFIGLDFHSTWYDIFYTNEKRDGTTMPKFVEEWFSALEKKIDGYKVNEQAGNSKKPVSKGWFLYGHNAVGITYEIGDTTPKGKIDEFGRLSAIEMMKLLINKHG